MQFEFYVLNYDHNRHKVEMFNIFNNIRVQEYTEKAIKKYLRSPKNFSYKPFSKNEEVIYGFNALVKEIDSIIKWQEWSRSEYEVSCGYAFETDCEKLEKIDCYYQAHKNIRMIVYDVIRQYKEQIKKENLQKSQELVYEFNKNKVTEDFLKSCNKAAKLFEKKEKD